MNKTENIMNTNDDLKDLFAYAKSEFLKENYGKSAELLAKLLEEDPIHKPALTTRGTAHLKMNHPDAAVADFDRVLHIDPSDARAYHLRGIAREIKGDRDGAVVDFTRAIELKPEYAAAYYSRAALYSKLGKEDSATEDIEMVTHLTNTNLEAFANQNNVWRSHQLRVEDMLESEMNR
jgi:tetratricopeptide (TPR) repeat protein